MNEVSNQSPHSATVRAPAVPSKPALTKKEGSHEAASSGKTLPRSAVLSAKSEIQKQQKIDNVSKRTALTKDSRVRESVEDAVAKMNEYTQSMRRDLQFNLDESSGRMVVTVVDRTSKEVIRQIPDEVFLKMARNLKHHMEVTAEKRIGESGGTALHLINTRA